MPKKATLEKRRAVARLIAAERGGSSAKYMADAAWCSYRHGASPENYLVLRFFSVAEREREAFLTSGRSKTADAELNRAATVADKMTIGRKNLFNDAFSALNRRQYIYAPSAAECELNRFLDEHPVIFVKPVGQTMGAGIRRIVTAEIEERAAFLSDCRDRGALLEEAITQHGDLAAINPDSVNTVRIVAARDRQGSTRIIGAALRCGGRGSSVDNFHGGGVAYTVDAALGTINFPGRDNSTLTDYICHPSTGVKVVGFQIPHWDKVLRCAERGMELVPSMGYVGWDMAVTPDGVELIEGNYSWPGGNIIQFDGTGKYPEVLRCLGR